MKKNKAIAIITGITGQDGSYLAELLLEKGYEVHGIVRPFKREEEDIALSNISHIHGMPQLKIHSCDVTDKQALSNYVRDICPSEIYHLAAQSSTPKSFEDEWGTFQTNIQSTMTLLSTLAEMRTNTRFYFAASSELFGDAVESPQNEKTPFNPNSPYGISKTAGFYLTKLYREKYSLFACSGICFSHESPRRGGVFVTRKITSAVARIKYGIADELRLGNLETKRDWGFSGDFVHAIWSMLQHEQPDDYVIGTGENHSIKEFVDRAFSYAGLNWKKYVVVDPKLFRPAEKNAWLADASKARRVLGWRPKTSFDELISMMMERDLECTKKEAEKMRNQD